MSKSLYEVIYEELKKDIMSGRYKHGDRIPSEKELSIQHNVSRITSKKSLEMLANEQLIQRIPGRGSFVDLESKVLLGGTEKEQESKKKGPKLIGLIISDFSSSFGIDLISGVEEACDGKAFHFIYRTLGAPEREEYAIQNMLQIGIDGLIIVPAKAKYFSDQILKLVIEKFPIVLVDRHFKGVAATSISSNNVDSARVATKYLLDLGHRNIGLLSPPPVANTTIEDRIEGFIQAHAEVGVVADKQLWINHIINTLPNAFNEENIKQDTEAIKSLIRSNPMLTAFFAIEYNIAVLAKKAIEELGMKVPENISIICFDSPKNQAEKNFQYTHMEQAEVEMGRKAVEMILNAEKDDSFLRDIILLDACLVKGNSTKDILNRNSDC